MILAFIVFVTIVMGAVALLTGKTQATVAQQTATDSASGSSQSNDTGVTVSNSDQSLTGAFITQDPSTWPGPSGPYQSASLWNIVTAVALAEGFNNGPGTAPYDLNNPGDLSPGDESGQQIAGPPQVHDGSSIISFLTCEGGFIALYLKFARIVAGKSSVYPVSWSWSQVAKKYAGDSQNWLNNVTSYLGVDPNSTPSSYQV